MTEVIAPVEPKEPIEGEQPENKATLTQEDFDKAFAIKLNKEREKLKGETEAAIAKAVEDKQKEIERQAKLSEDERRKEADGQREQELKELKDQNALLTNRATATKQLEELGVPSAFLDYVINVDADKTTENIETFDTTWKSALDKAVEAKLAGRTPEERQNQPSEAKISGTQVI